MKNTNFAVWLKSARKARDWSQEELSRQSGVSYAFIGMLERAVVNPKSNRPVRPSEEKLKMLCRALNVSLAEGRLMCGYAAEPANADSQRAVRIVERFDALPQSVRDDFETQLDALYYKYTKTKKKRA